MWAQHEVKLPAFRRGCHLITAQVAEAIAASLRGMNIGLVHVFSECGPKRCCQACRRGGGRASLPTCPGAALQLSSFLLGCKERLLGLSRLAGQTRAPASPAR